MKRKEFKLIDWNESNTALSVSFNDKDFAKSNGAKWCTKNRLWYIHRDAPAHKMLNDTFPLFTKAEINLIPETCWFSNLRSILPKKKWDVVRKKTYFDNSRACEFCRGRFSKIQPEKNHPIEAHELWEYDDINHVQTLKKVLCLCPDCHLTQHLGFANISGLQIPVMNHLASILKISEEEAETIAINAFEKWSERSSHEWSLNIDWLYEEFPDITEKDICLDR